MRTSFTAHRYIAIATLFIAILSTSASACDSFKDCWEEVETVGEQIVEEGTRVGEQIIDGGARVGEQIVEEGTRVGEQIIDGGARVGEQIVEEGTRAVDRMTISEFKKWKKEKDRLENQAKEEAKRAAIKAEQAVRKAARQADAEAKRLKDEAKRVAQQLEEEAKKAVEKTKEVERTVNQLYKVSIVDPGIEKFIKDTNEDIFEPIWPEIGKAFKSLCHNWCEVAEGQSHKDGKNDPTGFKSDGINQSYDDCMSCGCSLGFVSDEEGNTSPCFGGCENSQRHEACYVYAEQDLSPKQKAINDLANSLALFREVTGINTITNLESTTIQLNLPTAVENIFEKHIYGSSSKNNSVLAVYEPIDFLDRLKAPEINSETIDAISWNDVWSRYTTVESFRADQIFVRDELRDQNIAMASLGLIIAGTAKLTSDIATLAIDIGSGSGSVTAPIRTVVVEKVLSIANEGLGSQSSNEFAMKILVKNMGPAGMFAVDAVNVAQDVHMLMIEFPELINSSIAAKKDNLQRTSKAVFRANKVLKGWDKFIGEKARHEGIENPLELSKPEKYLLNSGEKQILLPSK